MQVHAQQILDCLRVVDAERLAREKDPALRSRVLSLKSFQHARFARTYADLLARPGYADAARFFLSDLYGPFDFAERDRQFARIVPGLVKLFPAEVVETVASLAELHAMSESLDSRMAREMTSDSIGDRSYAAAWRAVGEPRLRYRQIELTIGLGRALARHTQRAWLRQLLRAMRSPASMSGLGALQSFLEAGFDTFKELPNVDFFLETIDRRERQLAAALFSGSTVIPELT